MWYKIIQVSIASEPNNIVMFFSRSTFKAIHFFRPYHSILDEMLTSPKPVATETALAYMAIDIFPKCIHITGIEWMKLFVKWNLV